MNHAQLQADKSTAVHHKLRSALSTFATGVCVVTCSDGNSDYGMTCNSFTSVSLNPAKVLWCIDNTTLYYESFHHALGYCVNVLSLEQHHLVEKFAHGDHAQRFAGVPVTRLASGRLQIDGAVAWFDCTLERAIPAGDHHVLLANIDAFSQKAGELLVFGHSKLGCLRNL